MSVEEKPRAGRRARAVVKDIRKDLLDAAEGLLREEGYGAATARNIANRMGLKHQAVFYYFGTLDELLLALYRRTIEAQMERLNAALRSERPLSALWTVIGDREVAKFTLEFMALANHNEAIRSEIARNAENVRRLETEFLTEYFRKQGIEPRLSPQLVTILTHAVALFLAQEAALGIALGHEEAEGVIERSFQRFEAFGDSSREVEPIVGGLSSSPPSR
jgi:AcrR family transcriptional regulator